MLNNEALFDNIKKLCESNNIKITNLEKDLGFGGGVISRWGKNADPSLGKVIEIADYFDVSLDELTGRNLQTDDEFINSLINITKSKIIHWKNAYKKDDENFREYPKPGQDIGSIGQLINPFFVGYYANFKEGYISIYANYSSTQKIIEPKNVEMFFQPDKESGYLQLKYETNELSSLWKSILFSLDDKDKPKEVLIEQFKQDVINLSKQKAGE